MTARDLNTERSIRWFTEVWNGRDEALLATLMASDVAGEVEGGRIEGRDAWVDQVYRVFLEAFPDLQLEVVGTVAEGDEVMLRWRARGTHLGSSLGLRATGLALDFRGMTWLKWRDGQIVEGSDSWNRSGLAQALATGRSVDSVQVRG
jgi:steroid delta-isomerase-like uncharacterized protein